MLCEPSQVLPYCSTLGIIIWKPLEWTRRENCLGVLCGWPSNQCNRIQAESNSCYGFFFSGVEFPSLQVLNNWTWIIVLGSAHCNCNYFIITLKLKRKMFKVFIWCRHRTLMSNLSSFSTALTLILGEVSFCLRIQLLPWTTLSACLWLLEYNTSGWDSFPS